MDEVIGDLCLESLMEFIQTQVFGRDNGNIFICAKMRQGSRFVCWVMKTKNPAGARFLSGFAVGRRRTHCVTSTQKVYAIEDERAIPARILTFLSMDRLPDFVQKILFMHTVFIYTEGVRSERGGRSFTGATKSWLKRVVPSVP
ncbi:hypothetical protein [Enterobacter asburiae]|uniref:Uncharacterized protein n=2 Tax=Enterobacter TaxID=547 RepID=A0A7W3DBB4_ENTAS|nr:hypothetical protein [Enterobacter asburiae]ELF1048596.1 hypothetical protein [Enterobacter asburiae]MBA7985571.1 hypothetical protein [Enterobacter asburiae]MBA8075616.1 hypothetical protein [Enterobacter asburiae]MDX7664862.1 hypothetical protein [Enterobacter asburiae]